MSKIKSIDHIYIICNQEYEKDKYHKWLDWQKYNKIEDNYITYYFYKWGTELTEEDIKKYSTDDGTLVKLFPNRVNFPLKKSEISLSINFLHIFKTALEKKYDNILIFESDAILHPEFIKLLNKYMDELNKSYTVWHLFLIGCGMNKHYNKIKKNKSIYLANEMRCTDSMIISRNGLRVITENINKIKLPIDEHLEVLTKNNKLIILWLEPTIVVQGSQIGINSTTIRTTDAIYVKECSWINEVKFK